MQTPTDLARLMGRYTTVHTTSGIVGGTILAAGTNGVTVSVDHEVSSYSPDEVLSIQPRS